MEIIIEYEAKWSIKLTDSFGATTINSMQDLIINYQNAKNLSNDLKIKSSDSFEEKLNKINLFSSKNKNTNNYQYKTITKDTIMGLLSRFIGDVRRLDEIKLDPQNNFLYSIEDKISFKNVPSFYQNEIISLATKEKMLQNNGAGIINDNIDLIKKNDFTSLLYSPLIVEPKINEIVNFITSLKNNNIDNIKKYNDKININIIVSAFNFWQSYTKNIIEDENNYQILVDEFQVKKNKKDKQEKQKINILGLMIIEVLKYMVKNNLFIEERKNSLSKNGNLAGISTISGNLTIRELYKTLAKPKLSSSMPLELSIGPVFFDINEKNVNKDIKIGLIKEGGQIKIKLDFDSEEEKFFKTYLENSGIATFHVGKKGLGFIKQVKYEYH